MKNIMIEDARIKIVKTHIDALKEIAHILNTHQIQWHLGGSFMLFLRGFDLKVNDIDIIIKSTKVEDIEHLLRPYHLKQLKDDSMYKTEHFYELKVLGVDVDIMIGFKVQTKHGTYVYHEDCDIDLIEIDHTIIKLAALQEWYKAYTYMGRKEKIEMIEKALTINEPDH